MNSRENLPMMLSANDIQAMGFTRTMAYSILNREDVPVVKIGSRKFIQRDKFSTGWTVRRIEKMIKYNDTYIIGIDHGYGNLKTANTITASGVKMHDIEPPFKKELLEYDGKFICIGENHKSFTADKTTDMDNYYLTLYGIGKELSLAGITEANVHLAVGLPLMWYSEQRERFSEYMMQNENVEFIYNNKRYIVHIEGVSVFPQGYCAVYDRLKDMSGVNMIADIGNGTMNIMKVIDHKVITDSCRTEKLGVEKCVIEIRNALMNKFHEDIDESIIKKFLMKTEQELPQEYEKVMKACTEEYCKNILNALYKYDYNSRLMKLYVVGGGAVVMNNYNVNPPNATFITDVCANAKCFCQYPLTQFLQKIFGNFQ